MISLQHIKGLTDPTCSAFLSCNSKIVPVVEVDSIAYHQIVITMSGENPEGDATTRATMELQESMQSICEEIKVIKTIDYMYPYGKGI